MYRRQNRFNGGNKKAVKAFNPVNFIKTVDQTSAPSEYISRHKFEDFQIDQRLKENIFQKGYSSPTAIQDQAIPHILEGRDLIGVANTGTGKTAAFLIPLLNKVLKNRSKKVLIVTPTRELAVQIRDEFFHFSRGLNIYIALCMGGTSLYKQRNDLSRQYNFIIGTPGRLKALVQDKDLDFSQFDSVVLDEADRMVDIGFIDVVKYLVSNLPRTRQSLFFSATIDGKVREILTRFVSNPVAVSVKKQDTAENVDQDIVRVSGGQNKIEVLHDLLIQKNYDKVLIFGRTKWGVQKLSDELVKRGFMVGSIHGDKRQAQRLRTLQQFKNNNIRILIATDVASRGLDIDNVSHVINYDMPATFEDYIHRIGRTGRANSKGKALTFI